MRAARTALARDFVSSSTMFVRSIAAVLAAILMGTSASPAAAQGTAPVLVVGGTPAGVAAAVAAARRGQNVDLVTRRSELGGILSDAMMDQWDLNLSRDGTRIQGGIFSEIYAQLGDSFTPAAAARTFHELLAHEPRVHVLTDANVVSVETRPSGSAREIERVDFRTTSGRPVSIAPSAVVDATDNGDVAALAGARYDLGRQDTGHDERMQPVTLLFTLDGVDWATLESTYDVRRFGPGGATDRRAWGYGDLMQAYAPSQSDILIRDLNLGHEDGGGVTVNAIDVLGIDGLRDADRARARLETKREAPRLVAWLRTHLPGFANARVDRYADAMYVRETRHFAGLERLTADDIWAGRVPLDTIGLSSYPLDVHPTTAAEKPAYAPVRHIYGVPLGTLIPRDLTNVILASPAISATHLAAGSARIVPTTIEEGEAAGVALALAADRNESVSTLARDAAGLIALRADLVRDGVILPAISVKAVARVRMGARRA